MSETEFVCIGCPIGCPLRLTHEGREIVEIQGQACNRGAKYARQEFTDPRRNMSTTVAIVGARLPRLPVKVTKAIPKEKVLQAARDLHRISAQAPVRRGDVLVQDFLGESGCAVVACKTMLAAAGR